MAQSIESSLRKAVAALPPHDTSARLKLYRDANELLASKAHEYPPQVHQAIKDRLLATIREIEDELESGETLTLPPVADYVEPETVVAIDKPGALGFSSIRALSDRFRTTTILFASAAGLICLAVYALFFSYEVEQSSNSTSFGNTQNPVTESENTSTNQPVLFHTDFKDGLTSFGPVSEADSDKISVDIDAGILRVIGPATLFGKDFISINQDKGYFMRVVFRIIGDSPKVNPAIFAGFATYDGEKRLETSRPSHRYFVVDGTIAEGMIPDSEGWFWFGGIITGSGDRPDAFRSTSKFAKPVVIANFNKPGAVTEIKKIEVFDLSDK